jgi:hypothetical protein
VAAASDITMLVSAHRSLATVVEAGCKAIIGQRLKLWDSQRCQGHCRAEMVPNECALGRGLRVACDSLPLYPKI